MFKSWLYLIGEIEDNNYSAENVLCPKCKKKQIDYMYVGDSNTNIGYLSIWCNSCNKGVNMSRVMIPKGAKRLEFGNMEGIKNNIPRFEQVYPDIYK